tara:strand:+ start:1523 stop:1792 length:270 start_codon:yes stop_codon:yes gene_type:complete
MSQSKDKLIPDEPLIYENTDGIIWARYQNKPDIPRWIVGGDPEAISIQEGKMFSYIQWEDMMKQANTNPILKKYLQKAVEAYFLTKEDK